MDAQEIQAILEKHRLWLSGEEGGECANLWGATGNLKQVKSLFLDAYPVVYTSKYMQIGCERHLISDWFDFDDRGILEMDGRKSLDWWRNWKDIIFNVIQLSPAEPTKKEVETDKDDK